MRQKELVTLRDLAIFLRQIEKSQNWFCEQIKVSSALPPLWKKRGGISYKAQIVIDEFMKEYRGKFINNGNKNKDSKTT